MAARPQKQQPCTSAAQQRRRRIQTESDHQPQQDNKTSRESGATQASSRRKPENRLPRPHQLESGIECEPVPHPQLLDYSMTRTGIHAFTMALAANPAKRGIRINAVEPGPVWTPLNPSDQSEQDIQKFGRCSGTGRPVQAEQVSSACLFLAAPSCASYINRAAPPLMGGPHP